MDMADDLLSRFNQALAGADADESDSGASLLTSFVASPPVDTSRSPKPTSAQAVTRSAAARDRGAC